MEQCMTEYIKFLEVVRLQGLQRLSYLVNSTSLQDC